MRLVREHPYAAAFYGTLLLITLACLFFIARLPDRATLAGKAARIRPGMSQAKVKEIMGGEPGDYRTNKAPADEMVEDASLQTWVFDDGMVEVLYNSRWGTSDTAHLYVNNQPVDLPADPITGFFAWLGF